MLKTLKLILEVSTDISNTQRNLEIIEKVTLDENWLTKYLNANVEYSDEQKAILDRFDIQDLINQPFDLNYLIALPVNTLGYQYAKFMHDNNFDELQFSDRFMDKSKSNFRVKLISYELKIHDFIHPLLLAPTIPIGEYLNICFYANNNVKQYQTTYLLKFILCIMNFLVILQNLFYPKRIIQYFRLLKKIKIMAKKAKEYNAQDIRSLLEQDIDIARSTLGIVPFQVSDFATFG